MRLQAQQLGFDLRVAFGDLGRAEVKRGDSLLTRCQ